MTAATGGIPEGSAESGEGASRKNGQKCVFIYLTYLLSTYYALGTVLGAGEITVNEADNIPGLMELTCW